LPPGALSHIKYPVVVDASAFLEKTGFSHSKDEYETLEDFRRSLSEA
jgi:UDP-glucose 4-epimerase